MTHEPRIHVELTPGMLDSLLHPESSATGDLMAARALLRKARDVEAGCCGDIAKADAAQKAWIEARVYEDAAARLQRQAEGRKD
jgi:hypothetical protein